MIPFTARRTCVKHDDGDKVFRDETAHFVITQVPSWGPASRARWIIRKLLLMFLYCWADGDNAFACCNGRFDNEPGLINPDDVCRMK